jgi:hypothetical protein
MKRRILIGVFWICALLAVFLIWLRFSRSGTSVGLPTDNSETENTSTSSPVNPKQERTPNERSSGADRVSSIASISPTNADLERRDEAFKVAVAGKNVPINFWGKVVDQDGTPLGGVEVEMSTRQWESRSFLDMSGRFPRFTVHTDGGGRFELTGQAGDVLEFKSIKKEGYRLSERTPMTLKYDQNSDRLDPGSPMIFRMWKVGAKQTLVSFQKNTRTPYDGTPVFFDLLEGEVHLDAAVGDLRVTLHRSPLKVQFGGKTPYDWTATVEAVDGGVLESDDEFMYVAPENGYRTKLDITMPASAPNWSHRVKLAFYLKGRAGRLYGRVLVEFKTDSQQDKTGFSIDSVVNPSGSRNLE